MKYFFMILTLFSAAESFAKGCYQSADMGKIGVYYSCSTITPLPAKYQELYCDKKMIKSGNNAKVVIKVVDNCKSNWLAKCELTGAVIQKNLEDLKKIPGAEVKIGGQYLPLTSVMTNYFYEKKDVGMMQATCRGGKWTVK